MKIRIEKYKNIKSLELDLKDSKINFLYGISGAGKSSIATALTENEINPIDAEIGYKFEDIVIKINDKPIMNKSDYKVYNDNIVNQLVADEVEDKRIYDILFANDDELIKLQAQYKELISELSKYKFVLDNYIEKMRQLKKNVGNINIKGNQDFSKSSKIFKLKEELNKQKDTQYIQELRENGKNSDFLKWLLLGMKEPEYSDGICPFCLEYIKDERKKILDNIQSLNSDSMSLLFQDSTLMEELGIAKPNYFNSQSINNLKEQMIERISMESDVQNLLDLINNSLDTPLSNEIKVSEFFKKYFPKISDVINTLNSNILELQKASRQVRYETQKVIRKNVELINSYIERVGIPYHFKENILNYEENSASYLLVHKGDSTKQPRAHALSRGEKNILGLLFFLLSSKDDDLLIIDDPVSSFDDFRRRIIFDIIYEIQEKFVTKKTILVLSHDQVFIKFAAHAMSNKPIKKMFTAFTGNIQLLENYDEAIVKDVKFNDFGTSEKFIKNQLYENPNMEYYRKIINLRLLVELKANGSDIYYYLSGILHKKDRDTILEELQERSLKENDILDEIKNKFGVSLECVPEENYFDIDMSKLSYFEKIIYYRDEVNTVDLKKEMDNFVHFNDTLMVTLNPYEFNYFSPYLYEYINKKDTENKEETKV